MEPFDSYPQSGRALLGTVTGDTCRHHYGLQFMRITGQTKCAYCGAHFAARYQTWLTMALDHVVPASMCSDLGVPQEWREDCTNKVLACAACNSFDNRYKPTAGTPSAQSLEAFFDLRDKVFAERKARIAARREEEERSFEGRHWESR